MLRRARTYLVRFGTASLMLHPAFASAAATAQPAPLGFYYGWVTPDTAAQVQGYRAIVLGTDSESSGYANQQAVEQLVSSNPSISFYGYVNLSDGSNPIPMPQLAQAFAEWKGLGVRGISSISPGPTTAFGARSARGPSRRCTPWACARP